MSSNTPLVDVLAAHLPASITPVLHSQSHKSLETLLAFALGADCPSRLLDDRNDWSRNQPAALRALQDAIGPTVQKRARDSHDTDDPFPKRQKTTDQDDADDPPRFTLPSISTTSPVRKKVDITVHACSIRFVNPTTRALEASVPLTGITRAFLLPTRNKPKGHWTVVLLPADVPDKAKVSPVSAQQVIFGLDALCTAPFDTTAYALGTSAPTSTTVAKGAETAPALRTFLSHVPVPLLEPSLAIFRSACAAPGAGPGAAGVSAYLGAKAGTVWFFDAGILWGESKPCAFWAVGDLLPKDGVRLLSATGRMCSVILTRKHVSDGAADGGGDVSQGNEDVGDETAFSMVDGREQDPIDAWTRHRKHLFGKRSTVGDGKAASSRESAAGGVADRRRTTQLVNGTAKGPAWDDSDPDDIDFEVASSEDLEHSSTDEGEESEGEGSAGSGAETDSQNSEGIVESGEGPEEEEELDEARHPLLRPGAMPRMSKAAIRTVMDMVHRDFVDDASEEEDQLEE